MSNDCGMTTTAGSGATSRAEAERWTGGEFAAALAGGALTLVSLLFSFVFLWGRGWLWSWSLSVFLAVAPAVLGVTAILQGRRNRRRHTGRLLRAAGRGLALTWGVMLVLMVVFVTYNLTWGDYLH